MTLILTSWSVTHHLVFYLLPVVLITLLFYDLSTDYISVDHVLASTSIMSMVIVTELMFFICLLGSMTTSSLSHEAASEESLLINPYVANNESCSIDALEDMSDNLIWNGTLSANLESDLAQFSPHLSPLSIDHHTTPFISAIILASCILLSTLGISSIQNTQTILSVLFLGTLFLYRQYLEYTMELPFSINHSMHYSLFFSTTALHGSHVIVGLVVLTVLLFSITSIFNHSVSRICVSYWYMVDLVWYFVLLIIYCTVWQ